MKKTILLILTIILISSCKKFIWREIECRELDESEFNWYPGNLGDTISFIDKKNTKINFTLKDKQINHISKYISDTGCGCNDDFRMLYSNGLDSIWLWKSFRYVEKNKPKISGEIFFVVNGKRGGMYIDDYKSENNDIRIYDENDVNYKSHIKSIFYEKNIGIKQVKFSNGNIWKLNDTVKKISDKKSFNIKVSECK